MRLILVAATLLLAACSSARPSRPAPGTEEVTTLRVDNQSFVDMTVYVINGGQRVRLGLAVGKTMSAFTIPARIVGSGRDLSFLADPIGSDRTGTSNQLYVRAGQRVTLMIPP